MKRTSGVLLPVSALPGEYSIGSLGEEARRFVDFLREGGFSVWQTLPPVVTGEGDSPYKSFSAFSLNYFFIDLPTLRDAGLLTADEVAGARQSSPYLCEYPRLTEERFALLSRAAARIPDRAPIDDFLTTHPESERFCRFMALRRANDDRPFREFVTDRYREEDFYAWAFTQYTFYTQWQALHRYAQKAGVSLLGDMPIYVDEESADVWGNPHLFDLRADGRAAAVAGVPPDYFSEDGQRWGNPLYNWAAMRADGFAWWRARLAHTLDLYDGVRIDHFRGFASYYSIPSDAPNARTGHWRRGPGRALVDALRETAAGRLIVAEDLGGDEAPDVQRLLAYSGFPGMRVFQFAFLGNPDSVHLPHNYENNTVAYTGTHDNDTLLAYLFALSAQERRHVFDYCGYAGDDMNEGFSAVLHTMLASHAGMVVFPIQDLLRFGCDTRINRPGTATGNWAYRVTREQLASVDPAPFARENRLLGRV